MQKTLLNLALVLLTAQLVSAQNTWTGSSTSTQTNGNTALGTTISTSVRLSVFNNTNTNQTGISNYMSNTFVGDNWGIQFGTA